MTPRIEWTWDNFLASLSIRYHCWRYCACAGPGKPRPQLSELRPVWKFLQNAIVFEESDGSLSFRSEGGSTSSTMSSRVLPPQNPSPGAVNSAGTCGHDGLQFCVVPWPTTLGPKPNAPPESLALRPPGSYNYTACGRTCQTKADCGTSDGKAECVCAVPSPQDAMSLGLPWQGPRSGVSICLALAAATVSGMGGKRSLEHLDEEGKPYQCRCNATYPPDPACCGSQDGIIYK